MQICKQEEKMKDNLIYENFLFGPDQSCCYVTLDPAGKLEGFLLDNNCNITPVEWTFQNFSPKQEPAYLAKFHCLVQKPDYVDMLKKFSDITIYKIVEIDYLNQVFTLKEIETIQVNEWNHIQKDIKNKVPISYERPMVRFIAAFLRFITPTDEIIQEVIPYLVGKEATEEINQLLNSAYYYQEECKRLYQIIEMLPESYQKLFRLSYPLAC